MEMGALLVAEVLQRGFCTVANYDKKKNKQSRRACGHCKPHKRFPKAKSFNRGPTRQARLSKSERNRIYLLDMDN